MVLSHNDSLCNENVAEPFDAPVAFSLACILEFHHGNQTQKMVFGVIYILLGVLGSILNMCIIRRYFSNKVVREKVSNMLLTHQAFVDLFNIVGYVLLLTILMLTIQSTKVSVAFIISMYQMSGYSSLLSFTLVAVERWLAIWRPFWHKRNITKSKIRYGILCVWLIPTMKNIAYIPHIITETSTATLRKLVLFIFYLLILVTTILLAMSYIKARMALKKHKGRSTRKNLRLALIFSLMYFIFLLVTVTIVINVTFPISTTFYIQVLAFTLSSILNPIFTIILKKDFNIHLIKKHSTNDNGKLDYSSDSSFEEIRSDEIRTELSTIISS